VEKFKLRGEFIKLDALLKVVGVAPSGGMAKLLIADELVSVNGELETRRGKKIRSGDIVEVGLDGAPRIEVE
jgi:ribosome-associated protein